MYTKTIAFRFISRLLHLLAAGYIIGQSFSFFLAASPQFPDYPLMLRSTTSHNLYMTFGILSVLSGFLGVFLILYQYRPHKFHIQWEYMLFAKVVACLFLTRMTDWMVLKFMAHKTLSLMPEEMTKDFYLYTGTIKFLAMLIVLVLSTASKFYRQEVTNNFLRKGEEYVGDEY